jgi:hypothetical protein
MMMPTAIGSAREASLLATARTSREGVADRDGVVDGAALDDGVAVFGTTFPFAGAGGTEAAVATEAVPAEQVSLVRGLLAQAVILLVACGGRSPVRLNDPSAIVFTVVLMNTCPLLATVTCQATPAVWRAMSTPQSTLIWPVSSFWT